MNEELQSKMVEILTSVQNATKSAGDFAMEQLPDIAQSYIVFGRVQTLIEAVLSIAFIVVGVFALRAVSLHLKKHKDIYDADLFVVIFGGAFGVVMVPIGIISGKSAITSAALVWLAPKVWLLKELASFIK
jgi:hypothetical protein